MSIENIYTLVDFLADSLGSKYEIAIYEIGMSKEGKVIDIRNRHISQQSINSVLPKFISDSLYKKEFTRNPYKEFLVSSEKDGNIIKTSVLYINDEDSVFDYLLSISSYIKLNYDFEEISYDDKNKTDFINEIQNFSAIIQNEVQDGFKNNLQTNQVATDNSLQNQSIEESIKTKIDVILENLDIKTSNLTFNQKSEIIENLYQNEIFKIKGAIQVVSNYLNIAESSMYRYIRQCEKKMQEDNTDNFLI